MKAQNGSDLEDRINEAAESVALNIRRHNRLRLAIRKRVTKLPKPKEAEEQEEEERDENEIDA